MPAFRALGAVRRVAPAAADRVLDHPATGAWATRTALRLEEGRPVDLAPLTGVAAAAAMRGRVPMTLPALPAPDATLTLPSLGTAALSGPVTVSADGVLEGAELRPTPRLVVDGTEFLLEAWESEISEVTAGMALVSEPDVAAWQEMTAAAWDVLVRWHGSVAAELTAAVSVLTPLRAPSSGSSSATVADALGCVFVSYGPDPESMAESLAHELRHTKLIALLDLVPLLDAVPGERFYAPWREDPRPLLGLLHGTYAYAGVTEFWRQQRTHAYSSRADVEFARWRASALAATETLLTSGRLTDAGREFVSNMAAVLARRCAEPVPETASRAAARLSTEHMREWLERYRAAGE